MDHGTNHSSGRENNGVHTCSKCGWPFPKPHPSARHRRAHRKICGTIEGFKLVANGSDDEPNSDEDHKNPGAKVPKVMEVSSLEESDGGIGAMSNRSEHEVFSDAAVGRQDSLDNVGESEKTVDKDLTATVSSEHFDDSDVMQPPRNSVDGSQMPIMSTGTPDHQDSEDINASVSGVVPIETETLECVSEDSKNVVDGARSAECSVEQPIDPNENEEGKFNENLSDGLILPSGRAAGEISNTVCISEKRLVETSVTGLADKIIESSVVDRECASQDKCDTAVTIQLDEDVEMDASYMHVAEDKYELGGNHEAAVKEVLFEEKADLFPSHRWSDALSSFDADTDTTENEKDQKVCSVQEKQPVSVADDQTYVENTSCESMNNSLLSRTNQASNLLEVDKSDDIEKTETEKHDIDVIESVDGLGDLIKANSTSDSIRTDDQSPYIVQEVNETEGTHLDTVLNREDDVMEPELSRDNKVQGEGAGKDSAVEQLKEELIHSASYSEPTSPGSGAVDDSHSRDSRPASQTNTAIFQGESNNGSVKPQLDTTAGDISIGSSSHSLEAHWGSISVLSTQSDTFSEAEKAKKSKVTSKQHFDNKSDEFDLPSFTTLVEPENGDQEAVVSEIQAVQTGQSPRAMPMQAAGWFPSLTHVANESPGRKNNEEVIKKVTNWNASQRTPLKNLLYDSNSETKPKSVTSIQSPPRVVSRNEKVAEDNEDMRGKVSSIPSTGTPKAELTIKEPGNVWSSPARFPAEFKQGKRKLKGRRLWFQFVCCSSTNEFREHY